MLTGVRLLVGGSSHLQEVTTMLAGVRLLVGGSSHLQEVTRNRPIVGLLQKICASASMKPAIRVP
jgi:hypothetical protein